MEERTREQRTENREKRTEKREQRKENKEERKETETTETFGSLYSGLYHNI